MNSLHIIEQSVAFLLLESILYHRELKIKKDYGQSVNFFWVMGMFFLGDGCA